MIYKRRIICVAVVIWMLSYSAALFAAPVHEIVKLPYNSDIYQLAYKTFLANSNIVDALLVAQSAVKQRPDDLIWRAKLAKVAVWANRPDVAFGQWFYLAKETGDKAAIKNASALAKVTHQYEPMAELYLLQLKDSPQNKKAWLGYVSAEEARGRPQYAINMLRQQYRKTPQKFYLQQLARLYQNTSQPQKELNIREQLTKQVDLSIDNASRVAQLLYMQGKLRAAYQELLSVKQLANRGDANYWKTVAYLAWVLHDVKEARYAYKILYKNDKYTAEDLTNLIALTGKTDQSFSLRLAEHGWKKYRKDVFVNKILLLAPEQKDWTLLRKTLSSLRKDRLLTNQYYLHAQIQFWIHTHQYNKAVALYRRVIEQNPNDINLKVNYLWLLIDNNLVKQLTFAMQKWLPLLVLEQKLLSPYAAGYILLGKTDFALAIYNREFKYNRSDYDWLINYSDQLDSANYPNLANRIREYAWWRLLTNEKTLHNMDLRLAYARLASNIAPGDTARNAFISLKTGLSDERANNILMSWALSRKNYELAYYVAQHQPTNMVADVWIRQTIALHYNDRDELIYLLENKLSELPYRDRVLAAEQINNNRLAQYLAYKSMREHPTDSRMYQVMENAFLKQVDEVDGGIRYRRNGNVVGPDVYFSSKLFVTPRLYFAPYVNLWRVHSSKSVELIVPMSFVRSAGFKFGRIYREGELIVGFGENRGIADYINGFAQISYHLNRKLTTGLFIGINQPADDSSQLLLAGKQHTIQVTADYQYTDRDYLYAEVNQNYYYTQDGYKLGRGETLNGYYQHKLALTYPDWHVDLFGAVRRYQYAKNVKGKALKLVPTTQIASVDFFMPSNAIEYGLLFGYGEPLMENYTHAWRTFGQIGVFNNSDSGLGSLFMLGIAGTLFGRDHLAFYLTGSKNHESAKQLDYIVGMKYKLYF